MSSLNSLNRTMIRLSGLSSGLETDSIISSMMQMARDLSIHTVSEGIETRAQVEKLRALGCDTIQGNYFAKPMPREAYEGLLETRMIVPSPAEIDRPLRGAYTMA